MKNHFHLTIKCSAEELLTISKKIKAKPVSIDLWNNTTTQVDRMLTKYHRDIDTLKNTAHKDIQLIESLGYEVVRIKVEEVVENMRISHLENCHYLEGHIKVRSIENLEDVEGFILSRNNEKTSTRFYNFRIRNLVDYDKVSNGLSKILKNNNTLETEYERVIYDSNIKHDRWWG